MSLEPLIEKLSKNVQAARDALRSQFLSKIKNLTTTTGHGTPADMQEELEQFVDDILSELSSTYDDIIATIEEELPEVIAKPKPKKPRAKATKLKLDGEEQPPKQEFVKPTFVQRAFNDEGLRVSSEAKPKLMALLNDAIKRDIDRIKQQIPTISKGDNEGKRKRVTIKAEDVTPETLLAGPTPAMQASPAIGSQDDTERVLDSIQVDERVEVATIARVRKG